MDQFCAALALSVLVVSIFWYIFKPKVESSSPPLPPGPLGLPIVGYLPFLSGDLLHEFTNLAHKYGPIFKLQLGSKLCVVISSPNLTKEIVRDHDAIFSNRDPPIAAQVVTYGGNDIIWSELNSNWRLLRKIFVREMLSTSSLHASYNLRKDEVRRTIRVVYEKIGKAVVIGDLSFLTGMNLIMNMLWGGTIEGEEAEKIAVEFKREVPKVIDLIGKPNVSDAFPILARFDLQGLKRQVEMHLQPIERILDRVIARCREKNYKKGEGEGRKDFLQMILELQGKGDPDMSITDTQIKGLLQDIVAGSTDTATTTVEWAMSELINNQTVMRNAQEELLDVVGIDNIVEESHISRLRYLEAIVKETMRLHPPAPLLVPRSPSQSSTIGGYAIPKSTTVFINVWSMQRDHLLWANPLEFKPERFLNESENLDFSGNSFQYLPFGSGRRICPGLPLGEKMVGYLLGSLLHSFEWKLPDGGKLDMTEKFGIVLRRSSPLIAIPSPRLPNLNLYI